MGLAAPRKRRKLPTDPNNTAWSRSATSYGAKILAAHGWTPGSYLGARDAAHAAHYTAGSEGHIRVALRTENLGLGAGRGRSGGGGEGEDEGWAVGGLSDLLGRLNGKDQGEIGREQEARRAVAREREKARYLGQKFGGGRFVSAGFLTGTIGRVEGAEEKTAGKEGDVELALEKTSADDEDSLKRELKRRRTPVSDRPNVSSEETAKDERRRLRKEKRERREVRRLRKQQKDDSSSDTPGEEELLRSATTGVAVETTKTTSGSGPPDSTAQSSFAGSRQAVRQRYIRQKKMALMDPKALREIFMVKG